MIVFSLPCTCKECGYPLTLEEYRRHGGFCTACARLRFGDPDGEEQPRRR